ncbi:MAG: universal stress protein [Planctomycetales bacterium]|nr:universal stress protein [Planctomycetales bacterium]
MIRRILVGLGDEKHAASATRIALELAHRHEATLTGVSVLDIENVGYTGSVPIGAGQLAKELREHRLVEANRVIHQITQQFEAACEHAAVSYRLLQGAGDPFQSFIDSARYHDLIVCGLQHLLEHGVVDEPPEVLVRLIAAGVRPLLAVTAQPLRVHRTLIAYSGSMESAKTMRRFVEMRLWPETQLRIVTFKHRRGNEEQLLADAAEYCQSHGYDVSTELVPDVARSNVLPYAKQWNADLIVMGNSNKHLLLRRLLGETMLQTVKHTDRPLFLAQ